MPTNPVKNELKLGAIVLSAIEEFRPRAVEKLADLPIADGVAPVDYGGVLDDMHGRLTSPRARACGTARVGRFVRCATFTSW